MSEFLAVFGYGSLVNAATLPNGTKSIPGKLKGYQRAWRIAGDTPIGRVCGLTAEPNARASIQGTMILMPIEELPELDKREWRYNRHPLENGAFQPERKGETIPGERIVYLVKPEHERWGDRDHPLIQSYIDCVLRGYFERWGAIGVRRFADTTKGWHVPIHNDRAEPRYRRSVRITEEEEKLFDTVLEEAGARWL